MDVDNILETAHLYLGLSRKELERRISSGQIDLQLLIAQLEENSRETQLNTLCEELIKSNLLDQLDKFSSE